MRLKAPGMEAFLHETRREDGQAGYMYLLVHGERKQEIIRELAAGRLPQDVVVLEAGLGRPDERVRHEMELYYGIADAETLAA